MEHLRYCRKCGAFIPSWANECLACGEKEAERKPSVEKSDGDINLSPLLLNRASKDKVILGDFVLNNAYIGEAYIEEQPSYDCGRTIDGRVVKGPTMVKISMTIVGERLYKS